MSIYCVPSLRNFALEQLIETLAWGHLKLMKSCGTCEYFLRSIKLTNTKFRLVQTLSYSILNFQLAKRSKAIFSISNLEHVIVDVLVTQKKALLSFPIYLYFTDIIFLKCEYLNELGFWKVFKFFLENAKNFDNAAQLKHYEINRASRFCYTFRPRLQASCLFRPKGLTIIYITAKVSNNYFFSEKYLCFIEQSFVLMVLKLAYIKSWKGKTQKESILESPS